MQNNWQNKLELTDFAGKWRLIMQTHAWPQCAIVMEKMIFYTALRLSPSFSLSVFVYLVLSLDTYNDFSMHA